MKKEYLFVFVAGLFLLSYVLEAVVNPLPNVFANPYQFLQISNLSHYPFTAADIFIKSLAIFLTPVWLLSFIEGKHGLKAAILFISTGLLQLYALQEVVTKAKIMPLEWSISIAFGSAGLLIPTLYQVIMSLVHTTKEKFSSKKIETTSPLENPS